VFCLSDKMLAERFDSERQQVDLPAGALRLRRPDFDLVVDLLERPHNRERR
jgi:hypothetical protein